MKNFALLFFVILILLITGGLKAQTSNSVDCKDHPMFISLPNYHINECMVKDSGSFSFPVESRIAKDVRTQTIEGKYFSYSYKVKEDNKETDALLIFRSLDDTLMKNRGSIIARVVEPGNSRSFITGKVHRDNTDTWIYIQAPGLDYHLNIVEVHRKVKVISADEMWNALDKNDSLTVDIFFDDYTSVVIPASLPVIDEIYKLLTDHPSLKLSIQCHTDNSRHSTDNSLLTADRAKAVLDSLTAKGIVKARLTSIGWGANKPISNEKTEEGKAKNRRVVIVKKKD